jgi:hypothetical protein
MRVPLTAQAQITVIEVSPCAMALIVNHESLALDSTRLTLLVRTLERLHVLCLCGHWKIIFQCVEGGAASSRPCATTHGAGSWGCEKTFATTATFMVLKTLHHEGRTSAGRRVCEIHKS